MDSNPPGKDRTPTGNAKEQQVVQNEISMFNGLTQESYLGVGTQSSIGSTSPLQCNTSFTQQFELVLAGTYIGNGTQVPCSRNYFDSTTTLQYEMPFIKQFQVGYIVGLGDRHEMNILIDQATAEVVHIDLGVAFEQGLMLKTPERVLFKLTRDIIDGIGVTGVEGVFRRCCEKTVSVMQQIKKLC
ncbi:hypothetical protein Ddye_002334 [Dipteronia dyeriana]|uniref:PI3K/PI4K catalytic domain-containing protein n=1 Tax=Dipteronia dyeriana TaxID=168575 RepID=A0AAE0CU86_9ROSI|nr:hypothetical protein Ddye_002334 [Dipteronia dyeriana]